jgi:small subunit ribosomal protein S19
MTRSIKKGPYIAPCFQEKVARVKASGKKEVIKTYKRASVITPDVVGWNIAVHDGRKFVTIFVTENMVGHRLGEFAPTRTFRVHSGQRKAETASDSGSKPGVAKSGATKSGASAK